MSKGIRNLQKVFIFLLVFIFFVDANAQQAKLSKKISPDLFGIFFEDISFAADGGLYAELVQNRSFEYNPADRAGWNSMTGWEYITEGFGYGSISVETSSPVHAGNPHYAVLEIEEPGQKGIGLKNNGFDCIPLQANASYNFSVFIKQVSKEPVPVQVQLQDKKGIVYGVVSFNTKPGEWQKYTAVITSTQADDSACLVIKGMAKGKIAIDMVSLFPQKTFKDRPNGMRADLAETIAAIKPKFMRFPGGCLVHGDGLGNMYRWKNTIGPVEQRIDQKNIWNYHQSAGLGYFEYFQFCEDIGAKPLPVLSAGVSCQNSGGTWRIGSTGQHAMPMDEMKQYTDDILDLIEYANGPVTSEWGSKRAAAGHPAPFNLQYLGIGNEDKQTAGFRERFSYIYEIVKKKHPEITVVGTVGPFPDGEDFDLGWKFANQQSVPIVDEHYYQAPEWFMRNNLRYDKYDRNHSKVYVGEYASWGNKLKNALAEAMYMTALERNGDIVQMASYAPLLARTGHTSWNPNLIYFTGVSVLATVNYYVQQLFSINQGDVYYNDIVSFPARNEADSMLSASCVRDSKSGDIILKIINGGKSNQVAKINLPAFKNIDPLAACTILSGDPESTNSMEQPRNIVPVTTTCRATRSFVYTAVPYSLTVIRVKQKLK